jgi:hypothetical protein
MCSKSVEEANPTALATHSKNWPREPRLPRSGIDITLE